MRKLIDLADPFFTPLWVRAAVVVVCVVWGLFEMWAGAPLWGAFFLGLGAICVWRFATIDYSKGDVDQGDS